MVAREKTKLNPRIEIKDGETKTLKGLQGDMNNNALDTSRVFESKVKVLAFSPFILRAATLPSPKTVINILTA